MARRIKPERRSPNLAGLGIVALLALVVIGAFAAFARPPAGSLGGVSPAPQTSAPAVAGLPSNTPDSEAGSGPTVRPGSSPSAMPTLTPQPATTRAPDATPTTRPSPARSVSVRRPTAPAHPSEFDLAGQVIDIAFPIRSDVTYRYRDNWLDRRAGTADPYNHARVNQEGRLVRLHDGIDIYGPEGAPVLSPFDGRVVDPSTRWTPWEPDRYGLTVVIESTEPETAGYTAMLVHLDRVWVQVGQRVRRGEELGVLGRTGNAEDVRPQLHFELRAPFLIDWSPLGHDRRVDAFNPYPSLIEADPHR
jgi:murein DD-endopeptidase MepM/ murein hydrolase activator NlpD